MEETRYFGYICPKCGKAVMAGRTKFALSAAAIHVDCPCGESALEVQTDGVKFRLWVPCGLCGETHQAEVDAACVYVNAPTSFTDGAQFGLGAEIGISTQKLGARGPMGLNEITSYKWLIEGNGQTRK